MKTLANEIANFFKGGNTKLDDDEFLKKLLQVPEVAAVIARDETANAEARQALIAEMKKIPDEYAAAVAQADKKCSAAIAVIEELRQKTIAAREAHLAASALALGADCAARNAMQAAEKELRRTSDPRLDEYIFWVKQIDDILRNSWRYTEFNTQNKWTGERLTVYESNVQDIVVARAILKDAIASLDATKLTAASKHDVTRQLNKLSISLAKVLTQFDLAPPVLEFDEVVWDRKTPSRVAMQAAGLAPKDGSKWVDGKLVEGPAK